MDTCRAPVAGLDTAWHAAGPAAGPPVLLLHGGGIDRASRSWHETIPALAQAGYRVIAPDLPGYGDSEGFGRPHGIDDLRAWALALMAHLALGPAVVIGNSMGGGTALALALEHPERVRGVVPVAAFGLAPAPPLPPVFWLYSRSGSGRLIPFCATYSRALAWAGLCVLFARPSRVRRDHVEGLHREAPSQLRRQSFAHFIQHETTPRGFRTQHMPRLAQCRVPALYVHGRSDRLIPWRYGRAAARAHPGARLVSLDAGHWPMREQPEAFLAALLPWLEGLPE